MPSITQTIDWKADAETAGVSLADSGDGDHVRIEQIGATRSVQVSRPLRAEAGKPRNRRNQVGRRVFAVTYPPAASASAAQVALEALEDAIRDFTPVSSIVEWVFGAKVTTFSDASLESFSAELQGLTVRARFAFVYGDKSTADVTP